jgi:hypothetical protein
VKSIKYLVSISLLLMSFEAFAQVGRYDNTAQIVTSVNGVSLMAPAIGASVTVCSSPAVGGIASFGSGACTNRASICPDGTGIGCSTGAPNNPITADDQGNFGFWGASGTYQYTVCPTNGACQGPYYATIPGAGGGSGAQGPPGIPGVPGYSPNQLLNGCGVIWTSGLTFAVSPCTYIIAGVTYSTPLTMVTLPAADPSLDRLDVLAVDKTPNIVAIPGTPSVNPVQPSTDLATQLQLTFASIPAGALVPANIVVTDIYHENAEWTCTSSANVNCASTSNPHAGTKDIEFTAAATGNFVRLTIPSGTIDLSTRNNVVIWTSSKAVWPSTRALTLQWYNGTTAKCSPVLLKDGVFTFTSSTTAYQQIVLPTSVFNCAGIPVTRLQITVAGTGANLGFYLDDIQLQGGVANTSTFTGLIDRGLWNPTAAYLPHDFVFWNGGSWYAIAPNTNSAPTLTNTNWFSVGAVSPFISQSANPAQSGPIRLANNEGITWRNSTNTADCSFKLDSSNNYSYDGCGFVTTELDFITEACSSATLPASGHSTVCVDTASGFIGTKDSAGVVHLPSGLRTCMLQVGDGTNTVVSGDYAPFKTSACYIPYAATILEVEIQSDAGTPSVLLERRRGAATLADLLSGALAAAGTTRTCARAAISSTCYDGTTSSGSITLSNSTLAAGDILEVKNGTASTETSMRIMITFQPN